MKRISYISKFSRPLSREELMQISEISIRNNTRDNLTGILFSFNDIFYQVLEGPEDKLDECYSRILKDDRHKNIFCVEVEHNITERKYPDWAMKTIILEETSDSLIIPLRNILNSITKSFLIFNKYIPDEIINAVQSGDNPLNWKFKSNDRVILFTDIFSSSTLAENLSLIEFEELLEVYYNIVNSAIKRNNGEILKLTGDGILAYFDISLIKNALNSGIEICRELEIVRKNNKNNLQYLYTGIGITAGKVLEGNIGSEIKYDYTVIGDVVNRASRLESITRKVNYFLIFDHYIFDYIKKEEFNNLIKIGKYQPKGKTDLLTIYTLNEDSLKRKISIEEISSFIKQLRKI